MAQALSPAGKVQQSDERGTCATPFAPAVFFPL